MARNYDSLIQRTLHFLQSHASERLSLAEIAKEAGYSVPWLERIFIAATGRGIKSHLIRIRLERAKELLRATNLGISEIAYEVGYASHERFTAAFSKFAGVSPTVFRQAARRQNLAEAEKTGLSAAASRQWFSDLFRSKTPGIWWKFPSGSWTQNEGQIEGYSQEDACIQLMKPLPENFRVSFECFISPLAGAAYSNLLLLLRDDRGQTNYGRIELGLSESAPGAVRRFGMLVQANPRPLLKADSWQKIEMDLRDDTISVRVDTHDTISFRDAFPPRYSLRCILAINGWRSVIRIRNFHIEDQGYYNLAPAIRQGDALYNAGIFAQAREFFHRLQISAMSQGESGELDYKIGMCLLGEGDYAQARIPLEKAADLPAGAFWAQNATVALLDLLRKQEQYELFRQRAEMLFVKPALKEKVWAILENTCRDLADRGFPDQSLFLLQAVSKYEEKGSRLSLHILQFIGDNLIALNQFEAALLAFQEMADLCGPPKEASALSGIFGQADCLFHLGRFDEARQAVWEIRNRSRDIFTLARCEVYEGFFLRGERNYEAALKKFAGLHTLYPNARNFRVFALLLSSLIHCGRGKIGEAEADQETARNVDPDHPFLRTGTKSRFIYPLLHTKGDHEVAAQTILEDMEKQYLNTASTAENMVKAGILYELAGQKEKAAGVWREVIKRMPLSRCHFVAAVANGLLTNQFECMERLPYPVKVRSELFYLAGRLLEKRGRAEEAKIWFARSVAENRAGEWPGMLAERRLSPGPQSE